jgi:hypothetical protein
MKRLWLFFALCVAVASVITLSSYALPVISGSDTQEDSYDGRVGAVVTGPVSLSGTIKTGDDTNICAMVLASGQYMFSCNPVGVFSLSDLPREQNGTVKRQLYADGFFPKIDILTESSTDAVIMTRSGTCPGYNTQYDPAFVPDSAEKRINISGKVLLQDTQTPICAMALANGQHTFSCDGTGSYALNIPLDTNGQFKLQVYADGFAPTIQTFDEHSPENIVRMARDVECQSIGADQVNAILVSPNTVLFTENAQTTQLTATVYDKDGNVIDRELTWSSSDPQVVSVDIDGMVTSSSSIGSAMITASVGDTVSNTVTVLVADPVDGAVLVDDDQVVGEITSVDPEAPLGVGTRVAVRLSGITPPAPGTIVLGTGEQPVGGKVVTAVQDGDDVEAVLEAIPLDEMFDELVIEQEIDLSREVPTIAQIFADNYDVSWAPGGALEFTLRKTAQPSALTSRALASSTLSSTSIPMGTQVLNPNANLGPFECKGGSPFVLDGLPASLQVVPSLGWSFRYDSNQGGFQNVLVYGNITGKLKAGIIFTVALNAAVTCETKLGEIPIPLATSGALSALALYVPLSVGFEIGGKITLPQLGYEWQTDAKAFVFMGVSCPGGDNCSMIRNLDPEVKTKHGWKTPDTSGTLLSVLSQLRLEPSTSGYLVSGLELGFIPKLNIPARAKLLKVKAGVKLAGNFALVEGQMADAGYKSDYLLSQDSSIGAGLEFDAFGRLFRANILQADPLKITYKLAESPKVRSAESDVKDFATGDLVTFTVSLDPQHVNYPIIGYNVAKVSIYRRTEDDLGGVGPADLLAEVVPVDGVVEVQMTWTADLDDTIEGDYFAFVETEALPFPYFAELEVATIEPTDDCVYLLEIDSGTYKYIMGCRDLVDPSKYTTIYHIINTANGVDLVQYVDEGVSDTMWTNLDTLPESPCECAVTSGWSLVHDYDLVTHQDTHRFSYRSCQHPSSYNGMQCWPEIDGDGCGPFVCPLPEGIVTRNAFPGDCHAWWDHFDEEGVWHECAYVAP